MTALDVSSQKVSTAFSKPNTAQTTQTLAPVSTSLGRSWIAKIYNHLTLDRIAQAGIAGSVILGAKTSYETQKLEGPIVATLGAALSCLAWGVGSALQGKNGKALKCFAVATALTGISLLTSEARKENEELQQKLDAKKVEIESLKNALSKSSADCDAKILHLIGQHAPLFEAIATSKSDLATVKEELAQCIKTADDCKLESLRALNINNLDLVKQLRAAIGKRDVTGVKAAINAGVNINDINDEYRLKQTPLYEAVRLGDEEIVNLLIQAKPNLDFQDWTGETVLFSATEFGLQSVVEALIQAKADVNIKNKWGSTPLMKAAAMAGKDYHKILDALIQAKADLNMQDREGKTALIIAAKQGNIENVKKLLQAKADATIKDSSDNTALDYAKSNLDASNQKSVKLVRLLNQTIET